MRVKWQSNVLPLKKKKKRMSALFVDYKMPVFLLHRYSETQASLLISDLGHRLIERGTRG